MTETGLTRRARIRHCHCGVYVMTGLDADVAALEAVCDPRPLTAAGEATAWLSGLRTWQLSKPGGRFELDPRTSREISARPAGSRPRMDVLAEHRCDLRLPVACFGLSSFPEVAPAPPAGSTPPF